MKLNYLGRIVLLTFLSLMSCEKLPAQNFNIIGEKYISPYPSPYYIEFLSENKLKLVWDSGKSNDWDTEKEYNYEIVHDLGMPYISLDDMISKNIEQGVYSNVPEREFGNKILFLVGQVPVMETKFNSGRQYYPKIALGYSITADNSGSHIFLRDIPKFESTTRTYREPSSTLTEFGITYGIDNLDNIESDTPWVESVDGTGIGESFIIKNSWGEIYKYLFIINGFISADRPRLYSQNGRIKRIKVEGIESGDSGYCDILDTPHPQTVDISFIEKAEDIIITITDVYPGSKYSDTAIHYMITYDKEIVPYENSIDFNGK